MSIAVPTLRERRRRELRAAIQAHAVRLFAERGFDGTTVAEVAAAAGVSPMTVYRQFPTKEDLVLLARYDESIAERIRARADLEPVVRRVGAALIDVARDIDRARRERPDGDDALLLDRVKLMVDTPALRARHLDSQLATQRAILDALGPVEDDADAEFARHAAAAACLAALNAAFHRWAADDGRTELAGLLAAALTAAFGPLAPDEATLRS